MSLASKEKRYPQSDHLDLRGGVCVNALECVGTLLLVVTANVTRLKSHSVRILREGLFLM